MRVLAVHEVAPGVAVDGPAPELEDELRDLHHRAATRSLSRVADERDAGTPRHPASVRAACRSQRSLGTADHLSRNQLCDAAFRVVMDPSP